MDSEEEGRDPLSRFRLDGEVAVVTGAGSGIGRTVSLALAAVGARIVAADIDMKQAEEVAAAIAGRDGHAHPCHLDVADERSVERCFATAAAQGRVGALVNSAGISRRRPALDISVEEWESVNAVNVKGSFLCARAAARLMQNGEGGGSIVNIASALGFSGGLYPNVAYQTSKGAVVNLTRALAVEWARLGIRVNGVAPGWIETPFITNAATNPEVRKEIERATPMGRIGHVDEITGAVLFLASRASSFVTGQTIIVDGGFLAW